MGNENSESKVIQYLLKLVQGLPPKLHEKVETLFKMIDIDDSKTIDRDETLKFWSSNFAKINSSVLFDQVDKNNDGSIQYDEWLEFWKVVYDSGYSEDEICTELDNMINGGSWVKFETNKKLGGSQKVKKLKKEGKC